MAEAFAIAAAAVQFLDVGARLLIVLSQVCADLQHVPRKVKATVEELTEFVQLVRMLDVDIRAPNIGPASTLSGALSPAEVARVTSLLAQCVAEAEQLEIILRPLVPKPGDRAIKKGWRAVVGLRAEKEILERWTRLQGIKTSLGLWYNHHTLLLLRDQGLASDRIEEGVKVIEQRLTPLSDQLQTLRDSSESSSDAIKSMLHRAELGIGNLGQQYVSMAGNVATSETTIRATCANVESLKHESQSVQTGLSRIEDILSALERRSKAEQVPVITISQIDYNHLANQICQRIVSKPELAANIAADEVPEYVSPVEGYDSAHWKPPSRPSAPCTCFLRRSRWQLSWSTTLIHYDKREQHQRGCPWSWRSRARWTLGIRFLIPGLLARSLHATFSATYGAGGRTLTPSFTSERIVDRETSPAFRAIDTAREQLHDTLEFPRFNNNFFCFDIWRTRPTLSAQQRLSGARVILEKVRSELRSSFCAGEASPRDQDITGFTLLHDFVFLVMSMVELQESLLDQISGTIGMLVEGGVDLNAPYKTIGDMQDTMIVNALETTFLVLGSAFVQDPQVMPKRTTYSYKSLRLDRVLTQYGCEASEKFIRLMNLNDLPLALDIFVRNPDVALGQYIPFSPHIRRDYLKTSISKQARRLVDCGYSQLCHAVIQRSETELRRLIQCGHNIQREPGRKYSPLSLAIGWIVGLRILLEAGADPYSATLHAIGRRDEAAIEVLLPKCPMFDFRKLPSHITADYSVLSYALEIESSWTVIRLIMERLAQDCRQLAELAWENLSHRQLHCLGLNRKVKDMELLHGKEHRVVKALSKKGIKVPAKIQLCPYTTVYHDRNMTRDAADELWAYGFHAIDVPASPFRGRKSECSEPAPST